MLLSEIAVLKNRTTEMEKECMSHTLINWFVFNYLFHVVLLKMQQCNKYKSELVHFRKQAGLPVDDIPFDEG